MTLKIELDPIYDIEFVSYMFYTIIIILRNVKNTVLTSRRG
jgi:hypothetical protein